MNQTAARATGDAAVLRGLIAAGPSAFVFSGLAGAIGLVPGLAIPLLIRVFLDEYLVGAGTEWAVPLTIGLATAAFAAVFLNWLQYRVLSRFAVRLSAAGATAFAWHALRIPVPAVDAMGVGDITARGAATQRLAFQAGLLMPLALISVLTVAVFGAALLLLDLRLGLTALAVVVASLVVSALMLRGRSALQQEADGRRVAQSALTAEIVAGIETVKASAGEQWLFDRWARARDDTGRAVAALGAGSQRLGTIGSLTPTLGLGAVLAVGSALVLAGQLSLGTLVASQGILLQVLVRTGQLVWLGVLLKSVTSTERQASVIRGIALDPEVLNVAVRPRAVTPVHGPASIELRGVVFGYDRDVPPLLDGINLLVPAGARVAVVGSSGSGKSTLVRLIIGELQPWAGVVAIDGVPRLEVARDDRASALAYVPQSPVLLPGTIRDNITLFDQTVPRSAVMAAVRDARIETAIDARPRGLDEEIATATGGFSGGELQRIAIARALCGSPRLLVLDEATSALDPIVEEEIERSLRARACTMLVVAHRISTIRDADLIVVLDAGRIVQCGLYEELRTVGRFAELVHG